MKKVLLFFALMLSASMTFAQTAIVAHRGFWTCEEAVKSQNSIAALKCAQKEGFWGCELDLHITSDGVVIVNHDNNIGDKLIWDTPYSELRNELLPNGECRPTFEEYLREAVDQPQTKLVIEFKIQKNYLKEDELVHKTFDILKEYNMYDPERVMFISFSLNSCILIAREAPEFDNQYLYGNRTPEFLHALGINGIDYHYGVFEKNPDWVKRAHKLGMKVNVWTVDDAKIMKKFKGVEAITTNYPLVTREILGKSELKND